MNAWHASGFDSVVREGTTNSMRVTVLVPIDRDAWRLADAEHAAMREACAVQVADALNRSEPSIVVPMCDYEDCDQDGPVRIHEQTFCHYHATDGLLSGLDLDERRALMRLHDPDRIAVDRALVAELVDAIADLRGCDGNPFLTAANARAQRLALTLAGLLEAKP
jgi:hypothetical protein